MSARQIFTADIIRQLKANGRETTERDCYIDHVPVLKVYNPYGREAWIFTELDSDGDTLFGLLYNGGGRPELGTVSKDHLTRIRITPRGRAVNDHGRRVELGDPRTVQQPLERDLHFYTEHPLTVWLEAAQRAGKITEDETALEQAAYKLDHAA